MTEKVTKKTKDFRKYPDSILKLPKTMKIGGINYEIKYPHTFLETRGITGLHEGFFAVMKISTVDDNGNPSPVLRILDTWLHEMCHAIDFVCLGNHIGDNLPEDDYEKYIDTFAAAWLQVFRDNKLNLKSWDMPNTIRIMGFDYEVFFPHVFQDSLSEVAYSLNNPQLRMYIAGQSEGHKYPLDVVKCSLVCLITKAIIDVYIRSDFEFNVRALGCAFYQVFKDNDVEGVIRKALMLDGKG